jgi:hypothetical protein
MMRSVSEGFYLRFLLLLLLLHLLLVERHPSSEIVHSAGELLHTPSPSSSPSSSFIDSEVVEIAFHQLNLLVGPLQLESVVVNRACSALDGSVSAKVEVVLVRLSDSGLDQSTQQSNGVLVTAVLLREGADVVLLAGVVVMVLWVKGNVQKETGGQVVVWPGIGS